MLNQYQIKFRSLILKIISLNVIFRRTIFIFIDSILIVFSMKFSIYHSTESYSIDNYGYLTFLVLFISFILYPLSGQYKGISRYLDSSYIYKQSTRNIVLIIILMILINLLKFIPPPTKLWLFFWFVSTNLMILTRYIIKDILISLNISIKGKKDNIAIYGSGSAGAQLASAIKSSGSHNILAFIDDSSELWKRTLMGIKIIEPNSIDKLNKQLDKIFLAIPSISASRRRKIINKLRKYNIPIFLIPSIENLTSGKSKIDSFRPVSIEDILYRESVIPNKNLLNEAINGKVIFITGAAGSIGKELTTQILSLQPLEVILFDQNEEGIYELESSIKESYPYKKNIKFILGSTIDLNLLNKLFEDFKVDILFHAAAYKHVPILEENPLTGIYNNVYSSYNICKSAEKANIKTVILISSDKAVRPTNVMGASKRLSELIFQSFAEEQKNCPNKSENDSKTCFSMVRFGNVLGSSGSVVPLFSNQISKGGPITLTHPDITRYFMTIPEAAQLVLQASSLAKGGEVFLLEMGEPINIKQLAEQMIQLSNLTVKDKQNPNGDISITCTGLRPGEKLFEELLIDGNAKKTKHPLIYQAFESSITKENLTTMLDKLFIAIQKQETREAFSIVKKLVPEWK